MDQPKVLIVDDVEENLILLSFALKAFDVEIVKARSGFEAEDRCREDEYLLIILDVHMPDRTGLEAASIIRQDSKNKLTPIIFLTADTVANEIPRSAYNVGAVDVMFKPLEAARLRSKVQVFLDLYLERLKVERLMDQLAKSQFERVAQEKAQAVASLIGSLSHQFNNQLCIAEGYASSLLEDADVQQRKPLEKVVEAINACTSLLDTMQSFTGINQGTDTTTMTAAHLVADFSEALQGIAPPNLVLELEIADSLAELLMNAGPVRSILLPIAQFCADLKSFEQVAIEVRVRAEAYDGKLQFNLACQGASIDPGICDAIRDFFGVDDVIIQQQSLGLASARVIVEELNGQLSLTTRDLGFDLQVAIPGI